LENYDEPWSWRYDAKCADPEVYPPLIVQSEAEVFDENDDPVPNVVIFEEGEVNTELFFPPRDKAFYTPIANAAKAICTGKDGKGECPVKNQCLLYALGIEEEHGIFGGMSHRERNALLRRKAKEAPDLSIEEFVWSL
jgi:Transcription factor WhiB